MFFIEILFYYPFNITTGTTGCTVTNEVKTSTTRLINTAGASVSTQSDITYYDTTGPTSVLFSVLNNSTTQITTIANLPYDGDGIGNDPYYYYFNRHDGGSCSSSLANSGWITCGVG